MGYELNSKIKNLKPYDPIQGKYDIRLDANESCYNIPETLLIKVQNALSTITFNRYPDPYASEVCKAFADYYGIDSRYVTAFNGSDETLSLIMTCFLMKGDKAVTLSDDFSMYRFYCSLAEAESSVFKNNSDFTIDVDKLISFVNNEEAKMLILSNPCNPTSCGLIKEDIIKIITGVKALVILDEAYMDFWNQTLIDIVHEYDNVILLRTCSKAFGMAGIRLGFSVANETLTNALRAVKSPYNSNKLTQLIGKEVYCSKDMMRKRRDDIVSSREMLEKEIRKLTKTMGIDAYIPKSKTNFVLWKLDEAEAIYHYLLDNGVAVRFFSSGYLRITAGSESENKCVITLLKKYYQIKKD